MIVHAQMSGCVSRGASGAQGRKRDSGREQAGEHSWKTDSDVVLKAEQLAAGARLGMRCAPLCACERDRGRGSQP